MYEINFSKAYRKALKRIIRSKNFEIEELENVINLLTQGNKLDSKYRDHELSGKLNGFRECHVQRDILLVYMYKKQELVLVLVDLGTHSSLFD